jgi:hypothetical protein
VNCSKGTILLIPFLKSSSSFGEQYNKKTFWQRSENQKQDGLFLKLTWKERSSEYAKDDLWVVSTSPTFSSKNPNDMLFIAKSAFHGPARSGVMEV